MPLGPAHPVLTAETSGKPFPVLAGQVGPGWGVPDGSVGPGWGQGDLGLIVRTGGPGEEAGAERDRSLFPPMLCGRCPQLPDPTLRLLWPGLCGRLPLEPLSEPGVMPASPGGPPWLYLRLHRWLFRAPL